MGPVTSPATILPGIRCDFHPSWPFWRLVWPGGNGYDGGVTKVIEAIYEDGMLRPVGDLELAQNQRVRLIVQTIDAASAPSREAAVQRLRSGIAAMNFRLRGPLPRRDELHDRA